MSEEFFNDEVYIDWTTWAPLRDARLVLVSKQLRVEVGSAHKLFHLLERLEFLAEDEASDSVLVSNPEDHETAFIVHPTFSKITEKDGKYPSTFSIPTASIPKRLL